MALIIIEVDTPAVVPLALCQERLVQEAVGGLVVDPGAGTVAVMPARG